VKHYAFDSMDSRSVPALVKGTLQGDKCFQEQLHTKDGIPRDMYEDEELDEFDDCDVGNDEDYNTVDGEVTTTTNNVNTEQNVTHPSKTDEHPFTTSSPKQSRLGNTSAETLYASADSHQISKTLLTLWLLQTMSTVSTPPGCINFDVN
jgi:hypothetical protein